MKETKNIEPAKMQVDDILPFALVLVVVGIVIAFGLQVQGNIREDLCDDIDGAAWNDTGNVCQNQTGSNIMSDVSTNATLDAQEGVANLSEKLPTIGLIGGIVVVITLLVGGFIALQRS